MYKVLLGLLEPPAEATPAFIEEDMSEVGGVREQSLERMRLLRVCMPCHKQSLKTKPKNKA